MRLIEFLANVFINTFGITQPTGKTRRRASWFIGGLLFLAVVVALAALAIAFQAIRR